MTKLFKFPPIAGSTKPKKADYRASKKRVREMLREYQESVTILPSSRRCALYRHYDSAGCLLYVGISLAFMQRLMQHRQDSGWFMDIARVDVEWFDSAARAEEAERVAINTEGPIHNRQRRQPRDPRLSDPVRPANPLAPAEDRLSAWIQSKRDDQGLSMEDLAELSGVSARTVARVESESSRERTSLNTYSVLIQALGGRVEVVEELDNYVIARPEKTG